MELRQLRYFIKAKELLNFTEAADSLNISQSTLSQQIKQLEDELDIPLFNRIGKRIALTEAGQLFYNYALQSVNRANNGKLMLQELNQLQAGSLNIGVTYGLRYLLTPALMRFLRKFPKVKVQVVFGTSEELRHRLLSLELDILLTFEEVVHDAHLTYELLFESPLCLVSSAKDPVAQHDQVLLKDVVALPLVLPSNGFSTREFINNTLLQNKLSPNIALEINDIPTLLDLVKAGNWYTILAKTTVKGSGLSAVPIKGKNMVRKAMIITMTDVYEKKAVGQFRKFMLDEVKRR
ncbi:LysR family transcriptional regulator [Mucilaginibacter pallidiroseus]|uniref:LysR family transcriptional regulator n=1 Tax=Mucilaginibacter pallidiroseus TaxID=2599295 RepID=A0A563U4Z9_9SPHI|nr:LysR substrate-binding domain-containing protein [Mucilaginibacter pallidiroseus]TWR26421.1 LysR family transcriptional regulator [Mucilaginibacter pallidiroseus]